MKQESRSGSVVLDADVSSSTCASRTTCGELSPHLSSRITVTIVLGLSHLPCSLVVRLWSLGLREEKLIIALVSVTAGQSRSIDGGLQGRCRCITPETQEDDW